MLACAAGGGIKGKLGARLQDPKEVQNALTSLQLVKLIQDAQVSTPLEARYLPAAPVVMWVVQDLERQPIDRRQLAEWLKEQEFWSVLNPQGRGAKYF